MTDPKKPRPAEASYRAALEAALEAFRARNPAAAAGRAGAAFDPADGTVRLEMIGEDFRVLDRGARILRERDGSEARPAERVLILHYLATASGEPLAGRPVAFRELPGGAFYQTTFHAHTVTALVKAFGNDDRRFQTASEACGGRREAGSGVRMVFPALPRVPVTLGYWAGEEDMPPGAQILFDASVLSYLPLEDVAVLGETLAHRVAAASGAEGTVALYEYGD